MTTLASIFLIGSSSFFLVTGTIFKAWMRLKFSRIRPESKLLLSILKKNPKTYNGRNVVTTPVPSLLFGSSSLFEGNMDTHKFWDGFKFGQIGPWTVELAALERLDNVRNVVTTLVLSF